MSSQQQKPGQKRKAGEQGGQAKKANQGQQQQQAQAKQPQQQPKAQKPAQPQQQQAKKPQQQAGQPQKKPAAKKQPEPEPEEEEDDEDDEEGAGPERDPEQLEAIEKVQEAMDAITAELDAQDAQMNAEIYAVQRKHILAKRPLLKKRDQLIGGVKGLWKRLLSEHLTFASQMEQVDHDILDSLTVVEEQQDFAPADAEKQQIAGATVWFTFTASPLTKAGRFAKVFKFDDEKEVLVCVPSKEMPFAAKDFAKANPDSFFLNWFTSDGVDDGILAAQDALSSELYVDPLQLCAHIADGNPMPSMNDSDEEDDGDDQMVFEEDDDDEAPELADD